MYTNLIKIICLKYNTFLIKLKLFFNLCAKFIVIRIITRNKVMRTHSNTTTTAKNKSSKKRILIIEDDPIAQRLMSIALLDLFKVDIKDTGEKALACFKKNHYDLILTDIGLPGISGFSISKYIRQYNNSIPIIGITAHIDNNIYRARYKTSGLNQLLIKPVMPDILANTLSYWVN